MVDLTTLGIGTRLLGRLPGFLRGSLDLAEAREIRLRRLERRQASFLSLIRRAVYDQPRSPYRELLNHAGCEHGDLERLVEREGLEGALTVLFQEGVYLSIDEFKGRVPLKRGSFSFSTDLDPPRNPLCENHVAVQSSGSRGRSRPVLMDLAYVRACAVNASLVLDARGGSHWLKGDWETPGGARFRLLKYSCFGAPPVRWFSQLDPATSHHDPVYRWSDRAMRWGSRLAGVPLPRPMHAPLDNPICIAQWMREVLRRGQVPHLFTFPSSAVRLCQSAGEAGIDLGGTQLTIGGEPITEARMETIRRTGATAMPRYGSMECGPIGYGCLAPEATDDVHLLHDLHALIQPGPAGEQRGFPSRALFVSMLHSAAPFVMLNVSMGDQAIVQRRSCGCPLEKLGWVTHLLDVRSFEKLTGSGMTFLDTDVIRVLEEDLPSRFGGAPTDYQLMEQETEQGQPVLHLLVHPDLGPVDADAVAETFLSALGSQNQENRLMGAVWRETGILKVERRAPRTTRSGKILHLHLGQRTAC
jgi:hypothetical protein